MRGGGHRAGNAEFGEGAARGSGEEFARFGDLPAQEESAEAARLHDRRQDARQMRSRFFEHADAEGVAGPRRRGHFFHARAAGAAAAAVAAFHAAPRHVILRNPIQIRRGVYADRRAAGGVPQKPAAFHGGEPEPRADGGAADVRAGQAAARRASAARGGRPFRARKGQGAQ